MIDTTLDVINKLGLHARASGKLIDLTSRYRSTIRIGRGDQLVDGKNIMQVLMLGAGQGTRLRLWVYVDEADVGAVKLGQEASFTVAAFPRRSFPARITRVGFGSTITENVVTYRTDLDVDNPDMSLRPGMTATATITAARHDDVLLVPNKSLETPHYKIERLKLTTNLTDEGAGEVARVLRREQDKTLAASCAPDGTPWAPRETPRKGGGVDVLTNARSAVKVGAIGSTVLFALAPALQATRVELVRAVRGEVARDGRPGRARDALVVLQVLCSLYLQINRTVLKLTVFVIGRQ